MATIPWRLLRYTLIVTLICGAAWSQKPNAKRQANLERRKAAQETRADAAKTANAAPPGEVTADLPGAVNALKAGDEATAWQLVSERMEDFKSKWSTLDPEFVVWVADQYRKQKRFKDAQAVCDMVLTKERTIPRDMAGRIMLIKGDIFKDQENYQAAKLEYQGIERNKEFAGTPIRRKARYGIADLLRITKDYEGASEIIEQMKDSSDPETQAEAYYLSARIAFDKEMYDEVRKDIEEVKKRVPGHIEALFLEGELNLRQDRLQDPELEIGSKVLTGYIVPGRPITMKMMDRNLAVVRGAAGIPVLITTSKGGDQEFVTLLPSPRERTMFRGSISTTLGDATTNDIRLQIGGEDIITYNLLESYRRDNNLDFPDKQMLVVADGELLASSGDFISGDKFDQAILESQMASLDSEGRPKKKAFERTRDAKVIRPGNPLRIQVTDLDRDVSPKADQVFVDLESSTGDKVIGVALVETTNHSGIFRGKCPTAIAPPKASASGTAPGKGGPAAVVCAGASDGWTSDSDKSKRKWLEIDLMVVQPIAEASLEVPDAKSFKSVTLLGGEDGKALRPIATTMPKPEELYGYIDFLKSYAERNRSESQSTGYAYTEVKSDIDRDAVFRLGSCNGLTCWVNGEQIHSIAAERPWKPEEDKPVVRLKAGVNSILLKLNPGKTAWGGSLTITDTKGMPLPTMPVRPPAAPGVVTEWHIVDRPIPDNLRFPAKIAVAAPFRVADKVAHWIPSSTLGMAAMTVTNKEITTKFNQTASFRRLRWEFEEFAFVSSISVLKAKVVNKFGETLVPTANEFSMISSNRVLELSGGDKITVKYNDEHTTRGAKAVLTANMSAGFYNGNISLNYETIVDQGEGKRNITYDEALRFRAGITESLAVRVEDFDMDVSDEADRVKSLIETSGGQKLWLETIETEPHSGVFVGILRLGSITSNDTIKIAKGDTITASYADKDNSDGKVERAAKVGDVPDTLPELILYRGIAQLVIAENGAITGMTFSVEVPEEDGVTNPVITSMDAPLTFKVLYPPAALSSDSKLPVKLTTHRELAAAAAEKRDPGFNEIAIRLINGEDGEFGAEIDLETDPGLEGVGGGAEAGGHNQRRRGRSPGGLETQSTRAMLLVKGGDIVHIQVPPITGGQVIEGKARLVSDARLDFTDRKYSTLCNKIFASDWLYLRLSDRDLDVTDELNSTNIVLTTKAGQFPLELRETLPHSGIFTGRIKTERATSGKAPTNDTIGVDYGGTVQAAYSDVTSVRTNAPRIVTATMSIYKGSDGNLATFTKYFSDRDIAVKTRLLTAEALFELAKEHRKGDQKELAEQEISEGKLALEEALTDFPETKYKAHAEFLLANLAQELDNFQEALERYNKVISHWPDSEFAPRSQLKKAICLEKLNDAENALDAYVELTYAYPSSPLVPDAVIRLGQYFYKTKDYETAGKIFGSFHAKHPEHELAAKALFLSGQSYLKGAEELVAKSKTLTIPDSKIAAAIKTHYGEAIVKFDKLITSYDDKDLRAEGMYWLADCYFKTADMVNSYRIFKRLTWDYPESKWAKFARGQLVQNEKVFEHVAKEE